MKSSVYLFFILILSGCSFKSTVYQNPPAEGVVIDAFSFEPVAGARVWFEHGEPKTVAGADGRFELPPTYEVKYFRMMLPGSSFDSIPLYAEKEGTGTGIAWGHQFLNATREPDKSPIVVYLTSEVATTNVDDEDCNLSNEQQLSHSLINWLMGEISEENFTALKNEYSKHHALLSDQLLKQLDLIQNQCFYPVEITEEMNEAIEKLQKN